MVEYAVLYIVLLYIVLIDTSILYSVKVSANTMLSGLCNIVNTTTESHTIRRQVHEY